jgi:hypothetical protein
MTTLQAMRMLDSMDPKPAATATAAVVTEDPPETGGFLRRLVYGKG